MTERSYGVEKRRAVISRPIQLVLLSIGAILATLVVVELGFRVLGYPRILVPHSDPIRFVFTDRETAHGRLYINRPGRITFRYDGNPRGYFDELNEVHHDVNPTGFRGPAFKPKEDEAFRLVFLGDSFTFGEGVHNHDTYAEVAARILRKGGRRVESCNLGVGGYNTSQEAEVLDLFGFDLQPDTVIVGYTLNDAEPELFRNDPGTGKPVRRPREALIEAESAPRRPPDSPLYRLRIAQAMWISHRRRYLSKQTIDYYLAVNAPDSTDRIKSADALRNIISKCKQRGVPCIVVMFPLLYELTDDYPFRDLHEQVGKAVRQAGGRFVDLLPPLEGMDALNLIVHPTDQHPNEEVHAVAGRLVAEEIVRTSD